MDTALLVDSSPERLDHITAFLSQQGFQTIFAKTPLEAMTALESETVRLIILNIQMQGDDDLNFAGHLIKKFGQTLPPLIAVTEQDQALSSLDATSLAQSYGIQSILFLPVTAEKLQGALNGLTAKGLS